MTKNKNFPCYVVIALTVLGILLEIIGGIASQTDAIGFNFNLSVVTYVGAALIVLAFIAHLVLKIRQKKLGLDSKIMDAEAILLIIALFFAVIFIACCITFPVLFPKNG